MTGSESQSVNRCRDDRKPTNGQFTSVILPSPSPSFAPRIYPRFPRCPGSPRPPSRLTYDTCTTLAAVQYLYYRHRADGSATYSTTAPARSWSAATDDH